jgi:hypothetical protein
MAVALGINGLFIVKTFLEGASGIVRQATKITSM